MRSTSKCTLLPLLVSSPNQPLHVFAVIASFSRQIKHLYLSAVMSTSDLQWWCLGGVLYQNSLYHLGSLLLSLWKAAMLAVELNKIQKVIHSELPMKFQLNLSKQLGLMKIVEKLLQGQAPLSKTPPRNLTRQEILWNSKPPYLCSNAIGYIWVWGIVWSLVQETEWVIVNV